MSDTYLDKIPCPHCGNWIDEDYPDAVRDENIASLKAIVDQVDDELVVNWITVKDGDYRKALHDLVMQGIQIENDPAVSSTARARQEELAALKETLVACESLRQQYMDDVSKAGVTITALMGRVADLESALKQLEPFFKSDALMNRTDWHFAPARGERVQRAILAARAALHKPEK